MSVTNGSGSYRRGRQRKTGDGNCFRCHRNSTVWLRKLPSVVCFFWDATFREGECVHTPPGLDWFDLIEYYAFRLTLLISFLYTLYQVLKHKLKQ